MILYFLIITYLFGGFIFYWETSPKRLSLRKFNIYDYVVLITDVLFGVFIFVYFVYKAYQEND